MVACNTRNNKLTIEILKKTWVSNFNETDIYVYPGTRQILGTKVDPIKPGLLFHTEK